MLQIPALVRNIDGIPPDAFTQFQMDLNTRANKEGFSPTEKKSLKYNRFSGRVGILRAGSLEHFLRNNDLAVTQDDADDLTQTLNKKMPHTCRETFLVPALPSTTERINIGKRALVLGFLPLLSDEVDGIKNIIENYFEVSPSATNWPSVTIAAGCDYASTGHQYSDDVIDLAKEVMDTQKSFRNIRLRYAPVHIEQVAASDPNTLAVD